MPGKYYVYIPFDTKVVDELWGLAAAWRGNRESFLLGGVDRKTPNIIKFNSGRLSQIPEAPDDYTLYILAHCNKTYVTNTNNPFLIGRETLSPAVLANRLAGDGLLRNIKHLKLFACNSGVAADGAKHSFGKLLFHALITRGFDGLQLSAYTTPLMGATVDRTTRHKRAGDGSRPSTHRIRYPG
jgi:hypothetical protein